MGNPKHNDGTELEEFGEPIVNPPISTSSNVLSALAHPKRDTIDGNHANQQLWI